ncbi:MAG: phosphate acetyltransferase [Nitrospiraceae bacterium]|nr:MAG: phosphate acetyltransferase [Nitrospiraceae bacterium]
MPKGLYITGTVPGSGKSVVVLGMMEMLSGHGRKTGFFRPVIYPGENGDSLIRLLSTRYALEGAADEMYGCAFEEVRKFIANGRINDLYSLILEKYKKLESRCDFIICAGTDYTAMANAFEFEFNIEMANHLGIPLVPVVKGNGRSVRDIVEAVRVLKNSVRDKNGELLAVVVNRVAGEEHNKAETALKQEFTDAFPVYVLPDHPLLNKPTVGEIARLLKAEVISGDIESLDREIRNYKVAAMELPNFLDHVEDRSLIITPGDRSDIIIGSLLADASRAYPQIAGILLTGDLKPASQIVSLLSGLRGSLVPILSVQTDTFTTAMNVNAIEGTMAPENKRKTSAALGLMEANINFGELERRIAVTPSGRVTPLMFEYELIQRAKKERKHIVLPEGTDERILKACEILLLRGVADITLLGDPDEVAGKITDLGLSMDHVRIIDPANSELRTAFADTYYESRKHKGISYQMAYDVMADVNYFGTVMVHRGLADGMVSGAAHTTQHVVRPAFEIIRTKPGCSIVSSVFFMCLADRVFVFGDCAVNPKPSAQQLADIAISSAETAGMFSIEPYIAMLSYSTGESGKGEDVDRVREATGIVRRLRPDLKVEGPIQYDAAVDASVAKAKMPGSEVAGNTTVFIFPDLNTGNNTYKAVQRSANAVAIGPVMQGLKKPVNDLSRGCTVPDIVNTVAITAIQAQALKPTVPLTPGPSDP